MTVALDQHQVRALAEAFVDTLSKLTTKEREKVVTARFAGELNRLIVLAKEVATEHDARLWPEPVATVDAGAGLMQVLSTYAEIETAARQIVALLPLEPMFGVV